MAGQRNSNGKRSYPQSDYGDYGGYKRRNPDGDRDQFAIGLEDTVYRYLCPGKKIGSIIGRGGEIVKQLRLETKSKIRVGETVPSSDERVVTIYSSREETNELDDFENLVCPAQDALLKMHDRVVADDLSIDEGIDEAPHVTTRLLVPSDQIGCIIGKGGQIVQNLRSDTGAQIRIMKDDHLPACALISDELVQISGEPKVVRKALYQIALRLHDNPSKSQQMLTYAVPSVYSKSGSFVGSSAVGPMMGLAPVMGPYVGYKGESRDWSHSIYPAPRNESSSWEFSLRLICPNANIGGVIGKSGVIIKQIRQESGAVINVDSSGAEGDDRIISISAKECFEDTFSPVVEAALRLQPRCSEKVERDSGRVSFTTRLLVPTSRIGCLIGKRGSIISELRRITNATIRVLPKDDLPKIAHRDDEMVLISGELDTAKDALIQVILRLRANLFDREGGPSALVTVLPYFPMSNAGQDASKYESRENKRSGRSYSGGNSAPSNLPANGYDSYGFQRGSSRGYEAYDNYSSGRAGPSGFSAQSPVSRRKSYGY